MARIKSVHLIDPDSGRRASIARELYARDIRAEIYEDIGEFAVRIPTAGAVLAHDGDESDAGELVGLIGGNIGALPVAMFSRSPSPAMIVRAMTLGASFYLGWPFAPGEFERVLVALTWQGAPHDSAALKIAAARDAVGRLSRQEIEVLRALVDGYSSDAIARKLAIRPRAVEIHRANVLMKLGAASVADAVRIGIYASVDDLQNGFGETVVRKAQATMH